MSISAWKSSIVFIGVVGFVFIGTQLTRSKPRPVEPAMPAALFVTPPAPTLAEIAQQMMDLPRCKGATKDAMSATRRASLTQQIDRILTKIGGARATQETFILLLCVESKFRSGVKSPVGALGISQLMPATARAEATLMGLGDVHSDDLLDTEINLTIGYHHFMGLVKQFGDNHAVAAAAYNGGGNGSTVRGLAQGTSGAAETDKYVRDIFYLQEAKRAAAKEPANDSRE